MITTLLTIIGIWFLVSVPASLIIGAFLALSSEKSTPKPVSVRTITYETPTQPLTTDNQFESA